MHRKLFAASFSLVACASLASAQQTLSYDDDPNQSNFTWSGSTSLGAIVGNPSNAFQIDGTTSVSIAPVGGFGYGSVALVGGDSFTVTDIHGKIANVLPFLPPLATVDVLGLHLSPSSPTFAVDPITNAFTTTVTLTALSGTLVVTPLGGSAQVSDLTGQASTPSAASGTIGTSISLGSSFLAMPVSSTFPFSDPASGLTGTLTVAGTLTSIWTLPFPTHYCTAKTNSQGCVPAIAQNGLPFYSIPQPFLVTAGLVLNNKFGLLFYGSTPASQPFQGGTLCVKSPLKRLPVQNSGGNPPPNDCSGGFLVDFNARIQGGIDPNLVPGRVVCAQWWYRDSGFAAPNNTGLTDALQFTIAP
ncbi:MAG: hypothetical protein K8S98_06400 [Planctomycetes bacterium]|nr:hypothetical protein [Planctomycetota bacterium]